MKFFKRGQQTVNMAHPGFVRIRERIDTKQRQLAAGLQKRIERLSPKALALWLMGFCITTSSFFAFILIRAVVPSPVQQVTAPVIRSMDTLFVYPPSSPFKQK